MTNTEKVLFEKLDEILESNFENSSFSTDDICRELGISKSQLYRILKENFNLSTSLYIRKKRLLKAKVLLSEQNLKIAEVSYKIGIDSPQNFSKYFTQEFGLSPKEYRKYLQNQEDETPTDVVSDSPQKKQQNPSKIPGRLIPFGIGISVLLLILLGIFLWQKNQEPLTDNTPDFNIPVGISENTIAILPFKNLGTTENKVLVDGVMEQIHHSLSQISTIKVISTTSSNRYLNTKKQIHQIAAELHVKYLMEGAVLQIKDQIRITIELINANEDRVIWTKKFEGDKKNIFTYMNTVSKSVVTELNQKLNSEQISKLNRVPTKNLEAYNEYLQAQQLLSTRTKDKMEASINKSNNAIRLDPDFADAYTSIATAYFILGEDQFIDFQTSIRLSEKNALTAIRLDPENARAYAILANIYKAQNKWEQAVTAFQIALKFSPNDAQINYWYSLTIRAIGLLDEAVKYSSKAITLDPLSSNIYGGHIIGCSYAGKFDLAEIAIKEGESLFKEANLFHNAKAFYFITRQNYAEALKEFKICLDLYPNSINFEVMIAYSQAKLGQSAPAISFLKTLPDTPENYKNFSVIYAGLEDKKQCLKYLEMAADANNIPNSLKVSPLFSFLHNNPGFNNILRKAGLLNTSIHLK